MEPLDLVHPVRITLGRRVLTAAPRRNSHLPACIAVSPKSDHRTLPGADRAPGGRTYQ